MISQLNNRELRHSAKLEAIMSRRTVRKDTTVVTHVLNVHGIDYVTVICTGYAHPSINYESPSHSGLFLLPYLTSPPSVVS